VNGKAAKPIVEVRYNPSGWWDVCSGGEVLLRCVSEFQAWEAGRVAARNEGADLLIHQLEGPEKYEAYDETTDTMRPAGAPAFEETRPPAAPGPRTLARPATRRALILLVEATLEARELYAEYLTYAGYGVVTAINGHEALRLARLLSPDAILMALRMPGMDGLQATVQLKRDPSLAHIPVVAIGGDVSHEVNERARLAGCSAFITDAALPDQVAEEITRVLALPRQG
jgi:two-component system, cell cycle response regulator DivK